MSMSNKTAGFIAILSVSAAASGCDVGEDSVDSRPVENEVATVQRPLYEDRCSVPEAAAAVGWLTGLFNFPFVSGTFGWSNAQTYATASGLQSGISPCAWHDHCYHSGRGAYGYSRDQCDAQFNAKMKSVCNNKYSSWYELPLRAYCHWQRALVHGGVRLGGDKFFRTPACADPTWMYVGPEKAGKSPYMKTVDEIQCSTRRFPEEYFEGPLTGVQERRKKLSGFAETLGTTVDSWLAESSNIWVEDDHRSSVVLVQAPMSVGTMLDRYVQYNSCSVWYNSPVPDSYPNGCNYTSRTVPKWAAPEYQFPPNVPCVWYSLSLPSQDPYFQLLKRYFPQRFDDEMRNIIAPPPGYYNASQCKSAYVQGWGHSEVAPSVLVWGAENPRLFENAFAQEVDKVVEQQEKEAFGEALWAPLLGAM